MQRAIGTCSPATSSAHCSATGRCAALAQHRGMCELRVYDLNCVALIMVNVRLTVTAVVVAKVSRTPSCRQFSQTSSHACEHGVRAILHRTLCRPRRCHALPCPALKACTPLARCLVNSSMQWQSKKAFDSKRHSQGSSGWEIAHRWHRAVQFSLTVHAGAAQRRIRRALLV